MTNTLYGRAHRVFVRQRAEAKSGHENARDWWAAGGSGAFLWLIEVKVYVLLRGVSVRVYWDITEGITTETDIDL